MATKIEQIAQELEATHSPTEAQLMIALIRALDVINETFGSYK